MLADNDIRELLEERYINPIKEISAKIELSKQDIIYEISKSYESQTKEEMLLRFRRAIEMIVKSNLILTVTSLTNQNLVAIRKENFLQFVDDRYYTPLQVSTFMDIFRIETKNFKTMSATPLIVEPHIGLIINYILEHYTNTFTRFSNRNMEYYYIYEFFYKNGQEIKEILAYLNSYHFSREKEWVDLYYTQIDEIKEKVFSIYNEVKKLLEKI